MNAEDRLFILYTSGSTGKPKRVMHTTGGYLVHAAIRALMREGDAPVRRTSRASLRLLGTVGEPIDPEAWSRYHEVVRVGRCPIVDT